MAYVSRRHALALFGVAACVSTQAAVAAEAAADKPAYIALGEFTVNLPKSETLGYLVVDITLEAVPAAANSLKEIEPLLKETVVRRLLVMAKDGSLEPGRTDPMALKTALLQSMGKIRPNSIRDVLITRLLYG